MRDLKQGGIFHRKQDRQDRSDEPNTASPNATAAKETPASIHRRHTTAAPSTARAPSMTAPLVSIRRSDDCGKTER